MQANVASQAPANVPVFPTLDVRLPVTAEASPNSMQLHSVEEACDREGGVDSFVHGSVWKTL